MAEKISITKSFDNDTFDTYVPELSENADIQNAFELFYYGNSEDGNTTGDVSLHANLVDFDARITANDSDISGHTGATSDVHGTGAGQSVVGTGTVQTITNKTINLASNTLTGTLAQFNTALSDANLVSIAGAETLTSKTLTSPVITGGTINSGVALTVTSTELNIMDGVTASTAELNIMDGVTASTAELNIMDGVTATAAELNIMDGVTASTAELNYVDGVTSSIQTQINTLVSDVAGAVPAGTVSQFAGATAPTGYLLCDGTSYASASYTTLFNVIGYTFGGSGANFNVPNLKGKVVVGIDGAQVEFDTRGETGGAMTHQHAASNSGDSTPTTSGASTGNTTGGASAGNTTNGASAGNTTNNNSVSHTHSFDTPAASDTSNAPSSVTSSTLGSVSHSGYVHVYGYTPAASSTHTHGVTVNPVADDTGAQSVNHTHTTTDHTHTTTDHTHDTTDHTHTALHSHTTPASSSLSNLQPYMALNYIIKI